MGFAGTQADRVPRGRRYAEALVWSGQEGASGGGWRFSSAVTALGAASAHGGAPPLVGDTGRHRKHYGILRAGDEEHRGRPLVPEESFAGFV